MLAPRRASASGDADDVCLRLVRDNRVVQFIKDLLAEHHARYPEFQAPAGSHELLMELQNVIVTTLVRVLDPYPQPAPLLSTARLGRSIAAQAIDGEQFSSVPMRHNGVVGRVAGTPMAQQPAMGVSIMFFRRGAKFNGLGGSDPRRTAMAFDDCVAMITRELSDPFVSVARRQHNVVVGFRLPRHIIPSAFAKSHLYISLCKDRIDATHTPERTKTVGGRRFPGIPVYFGKAVVLLFDGFAINTGFEVQQVAFAFMRDLWSVLEYYTRDHIAAQERALRARAQTFTGTLAICDQLTATLMETAPRAVRSLEASAHGPVRAAAVVTNAARVTFPAVL